MWLASLSLVRVKQFPANVRILQRRGWLSSEHNRQSGARRQCLPWQLALGSILWTLQNTFHIPNLCANFMFLSTSYYWKRFKGAVQNIRDISAPVVSHLPSSPTEWQGGDGWVAEQWQWGSTNNGQAALRSVRMTDRMISRPTTNVNIGPETIYYLVCCMRIQISTNIYNYTNTNCGYATFKQQIY